jgi:hypothetical protein
MTIQRSVSVKRNKAWPRYRMICGVVTRILSAQDVPERLDDKHWKPTMR